ncbi:crossover junction endodeoxyribonuclease RuvC, partial [Candidatus Shapirobacteria bacterium]|nr:crossover junction endodeoxyribonuclease RuvC [Candidatus Shapirobacteria bacterium]
LAAQKQKIPVLSYPPLEIKMAITGYGRAEKGQVQKMVKNILHLETIPRPDDTADALAVGLTYCLVNKFKRETNI